MDAGRAEAVSSNDHQNFVLLMLKKQDEIIKMINLDISQKFFRKPL